VRKEVTPSVKWEAASECAIFTKDEVKVVLWFDYGDCIGAIYYNSEEEAGREMIDFDKGTFDVDNINKRLNIFGNNFSIELPLFTEENLIEIKYDEVESNRRKAEHRKERDAYVSAKTEREK